jgi:hypothetical protein
MRALALACLLALAPLGAAADPHPQLVASVQHRLDMLGFRQVDADRLSTRQVAALHMQLRGARFGPDYIRARQRVRAILRWDPPAPAPAPAAGAGG